MRYYKDENNNIYCLGEDNDGSYLGSQVHLAKKEWTEITKEEKELILNPAKTAEEIEQEQKATFKQNRATILDSIEWMGGRIRREKELVSQNIIPPIVPTWGTEQCNQYYIYCQALADRPSLITDWSSISYPQVPAHIYADMSESIKTLCQELKCDPI